MAGKKKEGKRALCLLTHGFQGSPFEMEPLAGPLQSLGLDTRLVTLPGHDSSLEEFKKTGYPDWLAHMRSEYARARREYEDVVLAGFSLGGTLSLHVAQEHEPAAVVTISSPVFPPRAWPGQFRDWRLIFLPILRFTTKELAIRPGRPESRAIAPWRGYEGVMHPPMLYGMFKGFSACRKGLEKVGAPVLVLHDVRDRVVNSDNALAIMAGVSSEVAELETTRVRENVTTHHMITTHRETREFVAARVSGFVARILGLPNPEKRV